MRRKRLGLSLLSSLFLLVVAASGNSCNSQQVGGNEDLAAPAPDMAYSGEGCGLATCQSLGATCGPIGDGCGNQLDCGKCPFPQTCGGGGAPSQCGGNGACAPLTCAQLALSCGTTGDGCGGTLNCYPNGATSCPIPGETCGGAGVNGQCGTAPTGGTTCVPKTCNDLAANCGTISDGCGGTVNCYDNGGSACPNAGETCGGGGVQFQCGKVTTCTPITSCGARNCGMIGDGCGGTLNCGGACPGAQTCGGGGTPNVCGPPACVPKTKANCGTSCGFINDGCGGSVDCSTVNTCPAGQTCGGGGMPNVCSSPACVPKTCAMLGANCGWAGDGCGNLICCGTLSGGVCSTTCPAGQLCGSLQPNQCGNNVSGGGGDICPPGSPTTITGKVVAPTITNPDPIFNATVFVPTDATKLQAITTGATCDQCATTQPAIVSTTTGVDGTFTLTNPPTGAGVTVVIQLGKWRRVLTVNVTPCMNNALNTGQTRLPRKQAEGSIYDNIPRFAVATGNVDVMECVLRKMGIDDTEFKAGDIGMGVPTTGRVQLYKNSSGVNGSSGAVYSSAGETPSDDKLWGNQTTLNAYDAVLFPCTGKADNKSAAAQTALVDYTNKGGRVFTTHYSYVWLYNNTQLGSVTPMATKSWQSTATWHADNANYGTTTYNGLVDLGFPKGINLSQWLQNNVPPAPVAVFGTAMTAASTNVPVGSTAGYPARGTLMIDQELITYSSFNAGNTQFRTITRGVNGTTAAAHAIGAKVSLWAQIPVGSVRWDFDAVGTGGQRWMYTQNATPGNGPANIPIHYTFNTPVGLPAANQCGRVVFSDFHVEDSSGAKNVVFPLECSNSAMTPQEKLLEFMLFDLTSCVAPDVPTCTPKTCNNVGAAKYTCGQWGDGCGGTLSCGTCAVAGETCGGAGVVGSCGAPKCVPKTCAMLGNVCGTFSDGCSGTLNCTCAAGSGDTCVSGQCIASCKALTCTQLGYSCGSWSDGCGGVAACNACPAPQTCGGAGVPGQCGGCVPLTCAKLGLMCGNSGDGCGGTLTCGTCNAPQTCGGGGTPGVCGNGVMCTPLTCAQLGLSCGSVGDGCGHVIDCGSCPSGQTCGGGGVNGQCGNTGCTPYTCTTVPGGPANCGLIGDGCGGTLNCGTCTSPNTCGGAGAANKCGVLG